MENIKQAIANATDYTFDELLERNGSREKSEVRFIFMHCLRRIDPNISLSEIRRIINRRQHHTVIYGLQKYNDLYEYDKAFRTMADDVWNEYLRLNGQCKEIEFEGWAYFGDDGEIAYICKNKANNNAKKVRVLVASLP